MEKIDQNDKLYNKEKNMILKSETSKQMMDHKIGDLDCSLQIQIFVVTQTYSQKKSKNYADNSKPQIRMISQVKILENKILRKKIEKLNKSTNKTVADANVQSG